LTEPTIDIGYASLQQLKPMPSSSGMYTVKILKTIDIHAIKYDWAQLWDDLISTTSCTT